MKLLAIALLSAGLLFGSTIDINTADKAELSSLNGIGDKKAEAIIAYRKGKCFKKVADLTAVKGIGEKLLEKNKGMIKAGKCKK